MYYTRLITMSMTLIELDGLIHSRVGGIMPNISTIEPAFYINLYLFNSIFNLTQFNVRY